MREPTNLDILDAIETITSNMVTKAYLEERLKPLLTKDDLENRLKPMATKEDLKKFATKDDLKPMATKEDLKKFATKDDLKSLATKDDIARLERKLDSHKQASNQHHLETRRQIGQLNREVSKINDKFDHLREGLAKAVEA